MTPISVTTEFIRTDHGDKVLAVASGSDYVVLKTMLRHIGIFDKFSLILGKEQVTKHKPDPEVYELAARQLKLSSTDCVVIEDTVVGAQAVLNAGMPVYLFLNGINNPVEFEGIDVSGFIASLDQLQNSLQYPYRETPQ